MARPEGGYPTEEAGVDDILDDAHAHHHDRTSYVQCITLATGVRSMILDRLHGNVVPETDYGL
jgi:hypothetical protein